MTHAINTAAVMPIGRSFGIQAPDIPPAALEALTLDPELQSRLGQLKRVVHVAQRDAVVFDNIATLYCADLLEEEDMPSLHVAHARTQQSQADLLRAFSFLMPGLVREDAAEDPEYLEAAAALAEDSLDAGSLVWSSHAQFFEQISALIAMLQTEWLAKYQDALGQFIKFYDKFSNIMEMLKPSSAGKDGEVTINFTEVYKRLDALAKETLTDSLILGKFPSLAAAEAFKKSVNLPGLQIYPPQDGGSYSLTMDVRAIDDLMSLMEDKEGKLLPANHVMDSAAYAAFVSAKDSNMEQIKHISKVLGEKLNEMTQKFDNIVKIFSSSIDKMSEANMTYARNT